MPAGLQVFDANSNLILDISDTITRIIGSVDVASGASGSVYSDALKTGRGWYYVFTRGTWGIANVPVVTFNQTTGIMSWSYPSSGSSYNAAAWIIYGVY